MEPVKHDSIPWGVPGEDLKSAKILNPQGSAASWCV